MRGTLPPVVSRIAAYMPLGPMALAARGLIGNALAARPGFLGRLSGYAGKRFAIDPVDCPFVFVITAADGCAEVRLVRDVGAGECDARIKAPLMVLLGMIDGTYDGDALFFSRDLMIEGDTEAVMALRNALEDAEIGPATALGLPLSWHGPFDRAAQLALDAVRERLHAPEASGPRVSA